MQIKSLLNIKGKETVALVGLNLMVITGLILFYVLVLRNNLPENTNQVLGTTDCTNNYVDGHVYHDKNTNGIKETGEEAVGGVKAEVKLTNGKSYSAITSVTSGWYKICFDNSDANLGARLMFTGLPGGYYPGPRGNNSDTLTSFFSTGGKPNYSLGVIIAGQDNAPAEIGNRVWHDLNSNGLQDPGEPGIAGVKVSLIDYSTGTQVAQTTTNSEGLYYFKSGVQEEKAYLVRIQKYQFDNGKVLDGLKTTKQVSDSFGGSLNSDAPQGNGGEKDIEFPIVLGSAQACNICIHNYDIGFIGTRTAVTSTPSSTPSSTATPTATSTSTSTPTPTATSITTTTQVPTATGIIGGASATPSSTVTVTVTTQATPSSTSTPIATVTSASADPTNDPEVSGAATIAPSVSVSDKPAILPATGLNYPLITAFSIGSISIGGFLLYKFNKNKFKIKLTRLKR